MNGHNLNIIQGFWPVTAPKTLYRKGLEVAIQGCEESRGLVLKLTLHNKHIVLGKADGDWWGGGNFCPGIANNSDPDSSQHTGNVSN